MYKRLKKLEIPKDFNFPFTPYKIQQQLMTELYEIIERGEIGIFESPTGTGKSLTLTCAALKWLEDNENETKQELEQRLEKLAKQMKDNEKPMANWFEMHAETSKIREEFVMLQETGRLLKIYDEKIKEKIQTVKCRFNRELEKHPSQSVLNKEGTLKRNDLNALDDFYNDNDNVNENDSTDDDSDEDDDEHGNKKYRPVQIYFCSRTHTQLAQIVKELKGTIYGNRIRCISLASRQHMCINKEVKSLNSVALINERCLNMIANSKKLSHSACAPRKIAKTSCTESNQQCCCYKSQSLINKLSDISLYNGNILDIEDIVQAGEKEQACPYYASRNSSEMAQLILLPYQLLLHNKTRQQTGINLKDNIVIIDEAHNILDTMMQMYSCELNLQQVETLHDQILSYKKCYIKKFHVNNLLCINQILYIIRSIIKMLKKRNGNESSIDVATKLISPLELMSEGEFFNINIYDLLTFCDRTRFVQKLQGFLNTNNNQTELSEETNDIKSSDSTTTMILKRMEKSHNNNVLSKQQQKEQLTKKPENDVEDDLVISKPSPIRIFIQFLECLIEKTENGRVLISIANDSQQDYKIKTIIKYLLLNPRDHFQQILNEARAIIVAGGTMQPIEELTQQLFSSCLDRVKVHCYDHVVSSNAILPMILSKGPSGRSLNFNYTQRATIEMLNDLTAILQNLSNVVPAGLVCFLPSFDYLDTFYNHLQKTGALDHISTKKVVFTEPHVYNTNKSGKVVSVEAMLNDYAKAIRLHKNYGALLLSVVGAKLSEGLNFSNDLGRGVIVVGLPYPNRHNSPELQERMSYLNKTFHSQAGQEYYENLCIKAINQCIGRAVRHIKDYACVYLLDERYNRECIKKKLPQWISRHIKVCDKYGEVQSGTVKFFKQHKLMEN